MVNLVNVFWFIFVFQYPNLISSFFYFFKKKNILSFVSIAAPWLTQQKPETASSPLQTLESHLDNVGVYLGLGCQTSFDLQFNIWCLTNLEVRNLREAAGDDHHRRVRVWGRSGLVAAQSPSVTAVWLVSASCRWYEENHLFMLILV